MNINVTLMQALINDWNDIHSENILYKKKTIEQISLKPINIDFTKLIMNLNFSKSIENFKFHLLLTEFSKLKQKEKKLSKNISINFNILDLFSISETLHSKLLGFFLLKDETHGQGDLFLRIFLKKLGFIYDEGSDWNVTVESQRIDILIWRENPHSVIIIENKSNNAIDQDNQIYRYWFNTIYSRIQNKDLSILNYSNYKIIYLVASDGKLPSPHSLKKPVDWSDDFPNVVPEELYPEIWFFRKEIREILYDSLQEINKNNHRIREYITQYIEYWNK